MKRILVVAVVALALSACNSLQSISGGSTPDIAGNAKLINDLESASYNLDQAVAVGAVPANDPAATCLHGLLQQAGIEVPAGGVAPKSFAPKNDGVVSLGAVAYIEAQKLKAASTVPVPPECKALIGQFVIDGLTTVNKLAPGAALRILP